MQPNTIPRRSREYDGVLRWLIPIACKTCHKTFYIPKYRLKSTSYCSCKCRDKGNGTSIATSCARCGKEFLRRKSQIRKARSGLQFCSRKCKDLSQRFEGIPEMHPSHYGRGAVKVPTLARIRGRRCQECRRTKWEGELIPLEVHHVDGDWTNNVLSNLRLLCPNCRAQIPIQKGPKKPGRYRRGGRSRRHEMLVHHSMGV
jgi:hypothetical protein